MVQPTLKTPNDMTTYTALRYQDNLYLVREPVLEEPSYTGRYMKDSGVDRAWTAYRAQFTSAILVPKEHEHLFEGRTGIPESKFEILYQLYDGDFWIAVPKHQYDKDKDFEKRIVAIPKEPGAGEESQDELWDKVCYMAVMDANIYRVHKDDTIKKLKEKFHITRKNP